MEVKQQYLYSLNGIKVIFTFLIFIWHTNILRAPDLGARCCELFFLISGFLMTYNNFGKHQYTYEESVKILAKKLKKIYPLHFLTFVMVLPLIYDQLYSLSKIKEYVVMASVNLLFLQSWFPAWMFSYNGVSWFFSSILFCYALTPAIMYIISRFNENNLKLLFFLLFVYFLRIAFEIFPSWYPKVFLYSVHVNPMIRLLEYTMGCICAYYLLRYKIVCINYIEKHNSCWSLLEFISVIGLTIVIYFFNGSWLRAYYLPFFLMFIIIFSFNSGLISRILSGRFFRLFGVIELEFFMFHQVVIRYFLTQNSNTLYTVFISFVITLILSFGYHRYTVRH